MKFSQFWRMERFFVRHPPVDLLVAGYIGYKSPVNNKREVFRGNGDALAEMKRMGAISSKNTNHLPAYLDTPAKRELIERMKNEAMQRAANGR